jgi:hypothetical protein
MMNIPEPTKNPEAGSNPTHDITVDAVIDGDSIRTLSPLLSVGEKTHEIRLTIHATMHVRQDAPAPQHSSSTAPTSQPASGTGIIRRGIAPFVAMVARTTAPLAVMLRLSNNQRLPLALFALGLLLIGQFLFRTESGSSTISLSIALTGAAFFAWASANLPLRRTASAGSASTEAPVWSPWRIATLIPLIWGMVTLLAILRGDGPVSVGSWVLAAWGAIIAGYCAVTLPWHLPKLRWHRPRRLTWFVLGIALVAVVTRGWQAGIIPATLSGDEGRFGQETRALLAGIIVDPFSTGWLSVPSMTFFFNAPSIAWLGSTMLGLRLPWIILGILNVIIAARLAMRLQGPVVGIITGFLLALYHYHIHYSRLGINNIADPFFMTLAIFFMMRAYDRRSTVDWVLCGITIGVGQYFYFGVRLIILVVLLSVLAMAYQRGARFWAEHGAGIRRAIGAGLLSAAPMIQYAWRFPDIYNSRINQVGIFQSGWLANEIAASSDPITILTSQVVRAALAFNAYPDRTVWYGLSEPLLDPVSGALLLAGLAVALRHLTNPRIFPMLAWWGGAILLGGVLTESPPSSQRLITAAIPTIFFVALALVTLAHMLRRTFTNFIHARRLVVVSLIGLVIAFGANSIKTYFIDYTPLRIFGGYNGIIATELGMFAQRELGSDWRIYFLGWPQMSIDFGSTFYLAPDTPGVDLPPFEGDPATLLRATPDLSAAFVVLPFRIDELAIIREAYPGGTLREIASPIRPELLFSVYLVPKSLIP